MSNAYPEPRAEPGLDLSIVIPAYNEAATIHDVIRDHDKVARSLGTDYEILVLDDGSEDDTRSEAERAARELPAVRVIDHATNRGIGESLLDLYSRAQGRWIFFNAADGQVPATELVELWRSRPGAALVVGRRVRRRDTPSRLAFARIYSGALRALFGIPIRDVHSVKLYRADALKASWPSASSSFAEDEILIALHRRGMTLVEVPIDHRPRRAGREHGASLRIAAGAIFDLIRFALRDRWGRSRRRPR